jgi:hypothetical protein
MPAAVPPNCEPDAPPPPPTRTPTAPLWIAAGGCLAVLLYCAVNEIWPGAVIAALAFMAALLSALLFQNRAGVACAPVRPLGGPYGNGPYRKAECTPNGRLIASLDELAGKLRELPEKDPDEWTLDWQPFDTQRSQAAAAAERGDYVEAVRRYSHAIRDVMRQLRNHRPDIDQEPASNAP